MSDKKFLDLIGLKHFKDKVQAEIDEKAALPTTVNDKYLHTNATTGEYEWVDVTSGGGTVKKVKVNGTEQGPDASGTVDIGTVITAHQDISGKQDKSSLESDVASKGFTKNAGTITGIAMNGASKGTSGVVDLGTVITAHQDISGKENKADLDTDVGALGYIKGTAAVTKVKINGEEKSPVSGVVDIGTVITEHQDITGKLDKPTTALTPASKCKVTYDANGLITAGADLTATDIPTIEQSQVNGLATALTGKLDVLGNEAISGKPYNMTYFFDKTADASKMTITAHTISMDNVKTVDTYSMDIPSASTTVAGLMSGTDKTRLDGILLTDASEVSGTLTISRKDGTTVTHSKTNVLDELTSTSATDALSANQGKVLNERINALSGLGRYLTTWNCVTGKPTTNPGTMPYTYKSGDYYVVSTIGDEGVTNYMPNGTIYNGSASTTPVGTTVFVNDTFRFDGTTWTLLHTEIPAQAFSSLTGEPRENTALAAEFDKYVKLLGTEPGSGQQYHFPYNVNSIVQETDKITTTFDTVTLDGLKSKVTYNLAIPAADPANDKAGLLTKALYDAKADGTALAQEVTNRTTAITNEATARGDADTALGGRIDTEKSRAEGAEGTLQTNITAEETRAKAAEQANTTAISTEKSRAEGVEASLQTAIDGKISLLGNEAVSGQPYHFTYYYGFTPAADKITAYVDTITLDNNKTPERFSTDIVGATTASAGLMVAADKTKLNGLNVKDASVSGTTLTLTRATGGDVTFNGEPSAYIKNASASGNVLTLTKKDDTTLTFTGEPSAYLKSASVSGNVLTLKDQSGTDIPFTGGPSAYIKSADVSTVNTLKLKTQADTDVTFTVDLTKLIDDGTTTAASNLTYSQSKIKEMILNLGGTFRGEFASHAALEAYTGEKLKNDYASVTIDETQSGATTMNIFNGSTWAYAYTISTAPLTFKTVNGEAITGTGNVQIIDDTLTTSTTKTYSVDKINTLTAEQDVNVELEMAYPALTLSGTIASADLPRLANGQGSLIAKIVMGASLIGYSRVHLSKLTVGSDTFFNGAGWVAIDVDDAGQNIYQQIDIAVDPTTGAVSGKVALMSADSMDFSISKTYQSGSIGNGLKTLDDAFSGHVGSSAVHVAAGEKDAWNAKTTVTASASGSSTTALQYLTVEGTEWKVPQVSVPTSGSSTTLLQYLDVNGVEYKIPQPTTAAWGSITGTLSSQTDLNNALSGKINTANIKTSWGTSPGDGNVPSEKLVKDALDLKASTSALATHTENGDIHVTATQKSAWDAKASASDLTALTTRVATLESTVTALTNRIAAIEANYLRSAS